EVPGTATLNAGSADMPRISCAAAGNCAVSGSYLDGSGHRQVFVADETNGSWGNAIEVPGTATRNTGTLAGANVDSSAVAGADDGSAGQVFVVGETNGSWGNAIEVPGTAELNTGTLESGGFAGVDSISCSAPGECAAGGYYTVDSGDKYDSPTTQAFVVDERN